jgi:hypothetical protein
MLPQNADTPAAAGRAVPLSALTFLPSTFTVQLSSSGTVNKTAVFFGFHGADHKGKMIPKSKGGVDKDDKRGYNHDDMRYGARISYQQRAGCAMCEIV